jgi:alpha-beta hydrolase superfamily lysophospholipase
MSTKVYVSGLETHVYGLDEVRKSNAHFVDVVFILHGRTGKAQDVEPFALAILDKEKAARASDVQRGLIVVSFDQRNHGHRQVSELANLVWDQGNQLHASVFYVRSSGQLRKAC